ncbi:hypothetical protein [Citrobacter sedlakii]|uniref:tail fiber/spike domain-containing protein n=1 Tax=Citrobacter sedlakii TaxID=67826 RepID=UPI003334FF12
MATQPTNLPVPSESQRDLKFNAGKIDEFVTSMGWTYTDRFGNKHYTIEGLRWIAQQAISAFGYITLDSFEAGNTLTLPNQILRLEDTGEYYRWDGAFPKTVPASSTPDSTGGIGSGAWIGVGDASLRSDLSKSTGAELVNTNSGNSVQESLEILSYSYGVRLSSYMQESDPLTSALAASREKKLPLIIDCDATYKTFLVYSNDRIIGCGDHTLTKAGNDKPSIPSAQQPERPSGTMTDFSSIDAGIIIVHPDNGSASNIIISGFNLKSESHCEYALHCTFMSFSKIEDMKFTGFNRGIRWFNAYSNQLSRIFSLYWYSDTDVYSEGICYEFSDGDYSSGTSNFLNNVTCTNYKRCFYAENMNYSTLTCCGGEGVNSHNDSVYGDIPQVFEFKNCVSIVLNSPYTENLYGGFFRAVSDGSGVSNGASTIVINGAEAIIGIFGTKNNVGAKLLNIEGRVNCIVNGGVLTGAASGYYLGFGGADGDSTLTISAMEMKYVLEQIRNDFGYDGINSVKGLMPVCNYRKGITVGTGTGIVTWKSAIEDNYSMGDGNFTKTAFGGFYHIIVRLPVSTTSDPGEVLLMLSDNETDAGVAIAQFYTPQVTSQRVSATIEYNGRLPGGKYLYVKCNGVNWNSNYDTDSMFGVQLT